MNDTKTKGILLIAVLALGIFAGGLAQADKYEANWKSLKKHQAAPEWFKDAKFGIYTHWGLCTQANGMVPSANDGWYGRSLYGKGSGTYKAHKKKLGHPSEFGYHDFIPHFKAEKFDADRWASLFKEAGARFAGPVAEHHDGFSMWDSEVTPWNAADMGPEKDIAGRLEEAIKERGMKYVMTFHHASCGRYEERDGVKMPSWFRKREELGNTDPKYRKLYYNMPVKEFYEVWQAKLIECIDKYQPDLIWHDSGLDSIERRNVREYLAYYFNKAEDWGEAVAVTYKQEDLPPEVGILDHERGRAQELTERVWLTDDSVGSWFYQGSGSAGRGASWVVDTLIEIVCRNGCMLLNVPPKPDGTLPDNAKETLRNVGDWLEVNGEAIYGTRPWSIPKEDDVRFTKKDGNVYALCLNWPKDILTLESMGSGGIHVTDVHLLGYNQELEWEQNEAALTINVPDEKPCKYAYAFKLGISGSGIHGGSVEYGDSPRQVEVSSSLLNYTEEPMEARVSLMLDGEEADSTNVKLAAGDQKRVQFSHTFPEGTEDVFEVSIDAEDFGKTTDTIAVHNLSGTWRFQRGDDMSWKDPDLDESGWEKVELPADWEKHSDYEKDPAYGWYRKTVHIPENWKGGPLELYLGKIDDIDATYINGKKIGSTGSFPPDSNGKHQKQRHYTVPAEAVRFGGANVIAIRVHDLHGTGGLYEGPLRIQ